MRPSQKQKTHKIETKRNVVHVRSVMYHELSRAHPRDFMSMPGSKRENVRSVIKKTPKGIFLHYGLNLFKKMSPASNYEYYRFDECKKQKICDGNHFYRDGTCLRHLRRLVLWHFFHLEFLLPHHFPSVPHAVSDTPLPEHFLCFFASPLGFLERTSRAPSSPGQCWKRTFHFSPCPRAATQSTRCGRC